MHNAAEEYGRALFDLAAEGDGDVIERDAKAVLAAFTAAPEYIRLLENPGIPEEKRRTALTRAVAGAHHVAGRSFLQAAQSSITVGHFII